MIKIDFGDLTKTLFAKAGDRLEKAVPGAVATIGVFLQGEIISRAPVDAGGLKGSYKVKREGDGVVVYSEKDYAPGVEYGTRPHQTDFQKEEFEENIRGWCQRHGLPEEAVWPIMQKIRREGTKPRPHLRPAVESNRDRVNDFWVQAFQKALAK